MTGITNMVMFSPSSIWSMGVMIPARLGSDMESLISSQLMLFSISIKNLELNPICRSSPKYSQPNLSSALLL